MINEAKNTLKGFQNKAMRTLAFAYKELNNVDELNKAALLQAENLSHLSLQAVVSISDPIRLDVPNAVEQCQQAGISIKMVTGDTSATAIEIAKQIGIWNEDATNEDEKALWHITGTDFAALNDSDAYALVDKLKVMSRARPTDKQRLVELLKSQNEVVAVTGDGTNDAPALNHAHVGLSLGSGTSVAKEASDMTLLDDSFRSITHAVMWGRSLYKNIQRFLYFQLVINLTVLLLVLGVALMGLEMPLTITQILWINLIMDTFAAMALASLSPSLDLLKEKPRKSSDFIISKSIFQSIIGVSVLFFGILISMLYIYNNHTNGNINTHELTILFTVFVMLQVWNLFNAKVLGTIQSAFQGLTKEWIIVTFGGKMFRTEPLSLVEWGVLMIVTSPVLWVGELYRLVKRKTTNKNK